jgi:putative methyltransferase
MKKFLLINYTSPTTYANEVPYLWLTLKSYFQKHSKNPSAWEWLNPVHSDISESADDLVQEILDATPDVLAISCYMWNDKLTMYIAEEVKTRAPWIKIIAGGPALYYEHDKSWFSNNWFIDVVCEYAAYGEVFITDYLDGTAINQIPFAIYPALGGSYWNKSNATFERRSFDYPLPYLDNVEYLKTFTKDKPKIILDTSRGCPYACSFCEWGGGTSTKVVFKSVEDAKRELEIIFAILQPHYVDIINANFGMVKDDITIAQKIVELNKQYKCVKQVNLYGPTKSNKKNLKEIFRLFSENGIMNDVKVSIQSTTQEVLDNISRIDMPYDEQIDLYNDLCVDFGVQLKVETMLGLPGETIDSFYDMVGKLTKSELLYPMMHEWMMLPSAPAANPEYIDKFKLVTKRVKYIKDDYDINCISRGDYDSIKTLTGKRNILKDPQWASPYDVVVSTYSYSIEDWAEMELFKYYFTFLFATNILTPIQRYLRNTNVDMGEFSRSLFKDFLIKIPTIHKIYNTFVQNVKEAEPIDIYYADLDSNLPYISHYSTLKFLILLNPDGFFKPLAQWLTSKYGEDPEFQIICEHLSDNIMTPMKSEIDQKQKIREILAMCKYWGGNLFLNDFRTKY